MRRWGAVAVLLVVGLALLPPGTGTAGGRMGSILTVEPVTVTYGDNVTVVAVLTDADNEAGLPGKVVNFLVHGQFYSALTDQTGRATWRGVSLRGLRSGTYAAGVRARFDGEAGRTYVEPSAAVADLNVTRRPLRVTPERVLREYGDPNPDAFPYRVENWAPGEGPAVLSVQPTCGTTATQASGVGTYAITCSGLQAENYDAVYESGLLTVRPAPMTIRPDDQRRTYGQSNPPLTVSYLGRWKLAEGPEVLTGALKCTAGAGNLRWAAPGVYAITCTGQSAENYALKYAEGILRVMPLAK